LLGSLLAEKKELIQAAEEFITLNRHVTVVGMQSFQVMMSLG
jgi:hypothetical protein